MTNNKKVSENNIKKKNTTNSKKNNNSTKNKSTSIKSKSNNVKKSDIKNNTLKKTKTNKSNSSNSKTNNSVVTKKLNKDNFKIKSVEITEIPKVEKIEYIKVKKRKLNKKNLFLLIFFIISLISLFVAIFNIIFWLNDNKNIDKQVEKINDITKIEVVENNKNTEIIEQKDIDKSDPYWDYIKMNMINVDFNELKKINSDTIGWLQVSGTNVNYPFVQTNNNEYYLNHDFDKNSNGGGWVFLDYRNNLSNQEKNTIIYGHGRQNKTIFGSLKNILDNEWINNKDNYVIKLSTEYENTLWQIFSVYHIPTTNDYIQTEFIDNNEFYTFAKMLLERSQYNFNTSVNELDQILTLSTCYNDNDKFVIHAKLIKRESRNL